MTDETQSVGIRKKSKSPRAPGISLGSAIREVERAYSAYGHADFNTPELASALGMSADSGSFLNKIGALRDYGLIEGRADSQRVSELFKGIYQSTTEGDANARRRLAMFALQNSETFAKLLQHFPNRVPEIAALALRLENQERFNRDRAKTVAQAFRDSLSDFGLLDASGNILKPRPDEKRDDDRTDPAPPADTSSVAATPLGQSRVEIPLGDGRKAVVFLPDDVGESDVRRIAAILRAYVE